ncbi:hypothetical protein EAL2_c15320 [Peptoclostridium acidaminophilum DSM 3953]|uniref:DUF4139 domain-containing protein n=1 Tax=Peptoclostridium acidaminophilum DSM 3953 TaxID=1286171 RepID=W8TKU0_PEPAC|nr:hypothetical protein [Peptoclostridium acidaminophilum]AHM56827.1 hypothetical protein EAL2_c15320 [Peptoclostridium acidaminophilum DSM 3953]
MTYISSSDQTTDLAITIYNDGFGMVKEKRKINIDENENMLQFQDVARKIETDSLIVEFIDIEEFNYDYDLVSREKLLEKYMDRIVYLYDKDEKIKTECRLLSTEGGIALENAETKEILLNPVGEIVLPELPGGLIVKPALIWKISPLKSKEVKVSYLTKGLSWIANYVIEMKEKSLNMVGWVNISNNSGASFQNAKIKLIAGDVNRCEKKSHSEFSGIMSCDEKVSNSFSKKSFCEYHAYSLQNPTALEDNQDKQISFINCMDVSYERYYSYDFDCYEDEVKVIIEIENKAEKGLGIPLPKGIIKAYKEDDEDGSLEFVGEDAIEHIHQGDIMKLYIGNAFNIKCKKKVIEHKKVNGFEHYREQFIISNYKDEEIILHVNKYMDADKSWEIIATTEEYIKITVDHIKFIVNILPNSEKVIDFKYRVDNSFHIEVDNK